MRGKLGLVVGLGIGYVLGTRAGRERYKQIQEAAATVWQLPPVQKQAARVGAFARSSLAAVPKSLWNGAVAVGRAVVADGSAGERARRGLAAAESTADDVIDDVRDAASDAETAGRAAAKAATKAAETPAKSTKASTSSTTKKPAARRTTTRRSTSTSKKD